MSERLNRHRIKGMRDTRMVADKLRKLGREEDLSLDQRVRIGVLKDN